MEKSLERLKGFAEGTATGISNENKVKAIRKAKIQQAKLERRLRK